MPGVVCQQRHLNAVVQLEFGQQPGQASFDGSDTQVQLSNNPSVGHPTTDCGRNVPHPEHSSQRAKQNILATDGPQAQAGRVTGCCILDVGTVETSDDEHVDVVGRKTGCPVILVSPRAIHQNLLGEGQGELFTDYRLPSEGGFEKLGESNRGTVRVYSSFGV